MRSSLILFILFSIQIFCQPTIFIKYKSDTALKQSVNSLSVFFEENSNIFSENSYEISSLEKKFGKLNNDLERIVTLRIDNIADREEALRYLNSLQDVEYVHVSGTYQIDYVPLDSLYSQQWGLQSINAEDAWNLFDSEPRKIIVALIDTGIDYFHPDIDNMIFENEGEKGIDANGNDKSTNGIDDDGNGFIDDYRGWDFVDKIDIYPAEIKDDFTDWDNDPMDDNGHGTNMAGIIAAEHNSFGIAGVGRNIKLLNLRSFDKNGSGEEDDAVASIIYAVKMGAEIINMSWGDSQFSLLLRDIIKYAYDNGVIIVGSSGNNSSDLPHYPSGFSEVICVGSIQENEALSGFSNFGSTIDVVAPGSQILTLDRNGSYKNVSGTSAAAPFVSAAAALIKSVKNDLSPAEIKQILKSTAKDLGDKGWDISFGAGNLNLFKALQILSPSTIEFNNPTQDFHTFGNDLSINVTCLSPYFESYTLYYGVGYNPEEWKTLETGSEEFQILNEDVYNLNISEFSDSVYTLRFVMNRVDGITQEERINFIIDRSPPEILSFSLFPAFLNEDETIQGSISSDDISTAKLFFRNTGTEDDFEFISLDGFVPNVGMTSQSHFGFIPVEKLISGIDLELYFEVTNLAGLSTIYKNKNEYFRFQNSFSRSTITAVKKSYFLPNGRIFKNPLIIDNAGPYILINENSTSEDVNLYEFDEFSGFNQVSSIKKRIPVGAGDFNGDNKTDILSLFVKNGFIDSQESLDSFDFTNQFSDSSGSFWPSAIDDIDKDGILEIIAFSSDTTITFWEVNNDLSLAEEQTLDLFSGSGAIFRSNNSLVGNFDTDDNNEIITADDFGRLNIFETVGSSSYRADKIIEYFLTIESQTLFAAGDFNGDAKKDIAVLMEFEENIFETPLIYTAVFDLYEDDITFHFQNMFIVAGSNFVSSFEKKYNSIDLEDLNNDGTDELIIFSHPNSYIFGYGVEKNLLLDFMTNVNSQSIFTGDLDGNGINEIGIPYGEQLNFYEYSESTLINAPVITDYYSIDEETVYFKWAGEENSVYIYKGLSSNELVKYDSVNTSSFSDIITDGNSYFYSVQFYDSNTGEILSQKSKIIELFPHDPGNLLQIIPLNKKTLELVFSLPLKKGIIDSKDIIIDQNINPTSNARSSENTLVINLSNELLNGDYTLRTVGIRDWYNTPYVDSTYVFNIEDGDDEDEYLFISGYEIINNNTLTISFNFSLDSIIAVNKINYVFSPNNLVEYIELINNNKSVRLTTRNPFGAVGREYVLKVNNLVSSVSTGSIPLKVNSGSEIVLTSNAENLDDIFVYPNPVETGFTNILTFANLTSRANIYIFSIDGIFINKLSEDDGNGGIDWDLRDLKGSTISSGIYFYKVISLDNLGNELQEKIGKFAVIK